MTHTDEGAFLLESLRRTRDLFLGEVAGVSEAQASFRPSADAWSIADCAEHVAIAERGMYKLIAAAGPRTEESDRRIDERILEMGRNREQKMAAPAGAHPRRRFATLAEAAAFFERCRSETIELVERSRGELRRLAVSHPLAGEIDGYQCALLMMAHPERHALQVREIKSQPGYPA